MNDDDLAKLQAEFPAFRIWHEDILGRSRFVSRSTIAGLNPHTVITDDLSELRDTLGPAHVPDEPVAFTIARANIARMYDYWLQGKDHQPADRAGADAVMDRFPEVAHVARANRAFLARAVRYVAQQGVRQFVDIGAGLPSSPNVHEMAREIIPGARVVYVDHDPVVLAHARALLAIDANVGVAPGDLTDPERLLADPDLTRLIDRAEPVCVLLASVLHFMSPVLADYAIAAVRRWMVPGSYLIVSAGTSTGTDPELLRELQAAYRDTAPVTGRTAEEITAWFAGLSLASPGVADVWAWRPDTIHRPAQSRARILAGVARKPLPSPGPQL